MDDIKDALRKMRKDAKSDTVAAKRFNEATRRAPATVIGLHPVIGKAEKSKVGTDGKEEYNQECDQLSTNEDISSNIAANGPGPDITNNMPAKNRSVSAIQRFLSTGSLKRLLSKEKVTEKPQGKSIWDRTSRNSTMSLDDNRNAIWINKKDGHVDILKERRKLYSEEQLHSEEHSHQQRKSSLSFGKGENRASKNATHDDKCNAIWTFGDDGNVDIKERRKLHCEKNNDQRTKRWSAPDISSGS